jgi:tetratricopeptide (TPR) repeat protein
LVALCARIPENETLMINNTRSVMAIGVAELEAKIARAKGDAEAEIAQLSKAVDLQDDLGYMEPPEWHYPVREALGGALLRHGRAAEAESVFRKDLEINPRNGRSLYGLLQSLRAQGKSVGVEWVTKEFEDAWKHAEAMLEVTKL